MKLDLQLNGKILYIFLGFDKSGILIFPLIALQRFSSKSSNGIQPLV